MNKIQLTQTGFESLETEYKELQEIKRPQAVDRLQKPDQWEISKKTASITQLVNPYLL